MEQFIIYNHRYSGCKRASKTGKETTFNSALLLIGFRALVSFLSSANVCKVYVKPLSTVGLVSGNELSHSRHCLTHLFHCHVSCGR